MKCEHLKATAAFPLRKGWLSPFLPFSPWMPSRLVNLMTEKPVACYRPILSRLHDKKADTTTGQLPSPDPARTQLPSSPWQLLQCPPPHLHHKHTQRACSLPHFLQPWEACWPEEDEEDAGWQGERKWACPVGPHHLHWPHRFSAAQAAHSSNGWQFRFVTFLWYNV